MKFNVLLLNSNILIRFNRMFLWPKWVDHINIVLFSIQYINPFQPSVAFHMETSHLISIANQMTGFYIECNWINLVKWINLVFLLSLWACICLLGMSVYEINEFVFVNNNAMEVSHNKTLFKFSDVTFTYFIPLVSFHTS